MQVRYIYIYIHSTYYIIYIYYYEGEKYVDNIPLCVAMTDPKRQIPAAYIPAYGHCNISFSYEINFIPCLYMRQFYLNTVLEIVTKSKHENF